MEEPQSPDPHHTKRLLVSGGCVFEFQKGKIRAIIHIKKKMQPGYFLAVWKVESVA